MEIQFESSFPNLNLEELKGNPVKEEKFKNEYKDSLRPVIGDDAEIDITSIKEGSVIVETKITYPATLADNFAAAIAAQTIISQLNDPDAPVKLAPMSEEFGIPEVDTTSIAITRLYPPSPPPMLPPAPSPPPQPSPPTSPPPPAPPAAIDVEIEFESRFPDLSHQDLKSDPEEEEKFKGEYEDALRPVFGDDPEIEIIDIREGSVIVTTKVIYPATLANNAGAATAAQEKILQINSPDTTVKLGAMSPEFGKFEIDTESIIVRQLDPSRPQSKNPPPSPVDELSVPQPPPPPPPSMKTGSGPSGALIGGIVGGIAVLIVLVICGYWIYKREQSKVAPRHSNERGLLISSSTQGASRPVAENVSRPTSAQSAANLQGTPSMPYHQSRPETIPVTATDGGSSFICWIPHTSATFKTRRTSNPASISEDDDDRVQYLTYVPVV